VVKVQQKVTVTVLEVDLERNRISLSMKTSPDARQTQPDARQTTPDAGQTTPEEHRERRKPGAGKKKDSKAPPARKEGFNNPFARAGLDSVLKKK
jgi:uncharacterized protein